MIVPQDSRILGRLAVLEHEVGNWTRGEAYLDEMVDVMRATPAVPTQPYVMPLITIPLVAHITGIPQRLDVAEEAARAVFGAPSVTTAIAHLVSSGLALIAVSRDDKEAASEQYTFLRAEAPGCDIFTGVCRGRLLGLLSQTMGNLAQAGEYFEEGLAFCRRSVLKPELAWTCCDYADLLLGQDGEGDRAKAIALPDESLAISSELGMRPLMERVLSRREILKA